MQDKQVCCPETIQWLDLETGLLQRLLECALYTHTTCGTHMHEWHFFIYMARECAYLRALRRVGNAKR